MIAEETQIKHSEIGDKGLFVMKQDDERMGILEYKRLSGNEVSAFHTKVEPAFGGQGVGKDLFNALVLWAQENDQKIHPACSFVKKMFERNPDLQELLA